MQLAYDPATKTSIDLVQVALGSWLFSNSGRGVKLSMNILAGCRVLSAVDTVIAVNGIF